MQPADPRQGLQSPKRRHRKTFPEREALRAAADAPRSIADLSAATKWGLPVSIGTKLGYLGARSEREGFMMLAIMLSMMSELFDRFNGCEAIVERKLNAALAMSTDGRERAIIVDALELLQ